jgi:DNA-binding transcriptional MerR regulator
MATSKKKIYFSISELADEFNVNKRIFRTCEEKGLIAPTISMLKRRVYSEYDRVRLKLILHCEAVGYTLDQVIDLIGVSDVTLGEAEQLKLSLKYGKNKLDELIKRSEELGFHQRTSILTDINMLSEYIKEIEAAKTVALSEDAAELHIQDEKRKEDEKELVQKPEKEHIKRPVRVAPVFAAALVIVFITGGYFYFQGNTLKTKPVNLAQNRQANTVTEQVYHNVVPSDNTTGKKEPSSESIEIAASPLSTQQGVSQKESQPEEPKELIDKKTIKSKAATTILLSKVSPDVEEKPIAPTTKETKLKKPADDLQLAETEKLIAAVPIAQIEETPAAKVETEKQQTPTTTSARDNQKTPAPSEKKEVVGDQLQQTQVAQTEKEIELKKPVEDLQPAETEKLIAAAPIAQIEETPAAKVETEKQQTPTTTSARDNKKTPAPSEKKEVVGDQPRQTQVAQTEKEIELKKPSEDLQPAETEKLIAAAPIAQIEETPVAKVETKQQQKPITEAAPETLKAPSPPKNQEGMSTTSVEDGKDKYLLASKEEISDRVDHTDRLKSFLRLYCLTYESKDIDKFATFFAHDAIEKDKPFHELLPKYRKNMELIESFKYRIELIDYSQAEGTDNIKVKGKFFIKYLLAGGEKWQESDGNISMELAQSGESYLVKRLNYGY